jgi:hypothetical protein
VKGGQLAVRIRSERGGSGMACVGVGQLLRRKVRASVRTLEKSQSQSQSQSVQTAERLTK